MVSKFLVKADENERITLPVSKKLADEKKELEKLAEAYGFKIPYNEEIEKVIAKINKQVKKDLVNFEQEGSPKGNDKDPNAIESQEGAFKEQNLSQ